MLLTPKSVNTALNTKFNAGGHQSPPIDEGRGSNEERRGGGDEESGGDERSGGDEGSGGEKEVVVRA